MGDPGHVGAVSTARIGHTAAILAWRHPRAEGGAGRCIGRTELRVPLRRAKRLAHRVRQAARRLAAPRCVWVSPRLRCRAVGRVLRGFGFAVTVDERLAELDFGTWDGRRWSEIPAAEVEAWGADLLHHAPGGGEALVALASRVHAFALEAVQAARGDQGPRLVLTHGGWLNALCHVPPGTGSLPAAAWPAPPRHGACVAWPPPAGIQAASAAAPWFVNAASAAAGGSRQP
jgi:alpha-ribazole phosphatase